MVDQYWRKIDNVENDIENAMQISSILLKLKGYDEKLEGLSKIDTNKNNISTNSGQISTNTGPISTNSGQISTNTGAISTNLGQISTNAGAISTNSGQISTNTGAISTNLTKIDNFTQYILKSGKDFEKKYIIEKQIFRFNKDKHFYTIFQKEIEYHFTKNSLLFVKNNMYYKYDNLSNDYYRLQHEYNIYDSENNLIHKYLFNKDTYYDKNLDPILHTNEDFCICFKKIKLNLQLRRHNRHGVGNIDLEIDDNENYINIDYLDRNNSSNLEKINTDISSNLGKINTNTAAISTNSGQTSTNTGAISSNSGQISTNESAISSNLGKINNIRKTIMLKNIHFTDFDSKDESFSRGLISLENIPNSPRTASIYTVNMGYYFKKGNFIEIDCKLMFQHSTYNYSHNTFLFYSLYEGIVGKNKPILFRETRRYNQFPLINDKDRMIAYNKSCYTVKYDMNTIIFDVTIATTHSKMTVDYLHYIVKNGLNYVSINHYGKS